MRFLWPSSAGLNAFEPGQVHEPHTHCDRDKLYFVLEGRGDLALAPADVVHSLANPGPGRLVVMVLMAPPPG